MQGCVGAIGFYFSPNSSGKFDYEEIIAIFSKKKDRQWQLLLNESIALCWYVLI